MTITFEPLRWRVRRVGTDRQFNGTRDLPCMARRVHLNDERSVVMTTKAKVENKTLEMKGKTEVLVGKVVGKAIKAKGVADQVESDLKNAGQDLKEAGKDLKKAAGRVKKVSRKS